MKSLLIAIYMFFAFLIFAPIKSKTPKVVPTPTKIPLPKVTPKRTIIPIVTPTPTPTPIIKPAIEKASIILGKNESDHNAIVISTKVSKIAVDIPLTMVKLKEGGLLSHPSKISPADLMVRFSNVINAIPLKMYHINLFFTKSTNLDKSSRNIISEVINEMKKREPCILNINGYSDTFGKTQDNIDISKQRALMVKNLLEKNDINISKININAFGESGLLVPTEDEVEEEKNRRVEITIR